MNSQVYQYIRSSFDPVFEKEYTIMVNTLFPDVDPQTAILTPVQMYTVITFIKPKLSPVYRTRLQMYIRLLSVLAAEAHSNNLCAALCDLKASNANISHLVVSAEQPASETDCAPAGQTTTVAPDDVESVPADPLQKYKNIINIWKNTSTSRAHFDKWAPKSLVKYYYDYFAHHEMFEHLEAAHALNYDRSNDLDVQIVSSDKLNVLKWLGDHNCIKNWENCALSAIARGNLLVLKYIREYCINLAIIWDREMRNFMYTAAINGKHLKIVQWLWMNNYFIPIEEIKRTARDAAANNIVAWFDEMTAKS